MGEAGSTRRIVATLGVAVLLAALSAAPSTAAPWLPAAPGGAATTVAGAGPAGLDGAAVVQEVRRRVGRERPLSDPVEAAAPESQGEQSVAFDGTNYLVVWRDHRQTEDRDTGDIRGARVTPEGRLLDPVGFVIADALVLEDEPEVAFGAGTYLVVWHDPHDDNMDVRGARVSPAGVVLDPAGIDISAGPDSFSFSPTVAFGDGKFLVTWEHYSGSTVGADVVGTRIDAAGTVVDRPAIAISHGPGNEYEPATSYGAGVFLVSWEDRRGDTSDVWGARVHPAGRLVAPAAPIFTSSENEDEVAAAFNGENFLVVFEHGPERRTKILGTRVTPAGAALDPAGIGVSTGSALTHDSPAVAALGSQFLVLWMDNYLLDGQDVSGARIDAGGRNLDPAGIALAPGAVTSRYSGRPFGMASNGRNWFVAWEDHRLDRANIFGGEISPAGAPVRPATLLTTAANDQIKTAIAHGGTNHLVAWLDSRLGKRALFAALVGPEPVSQLAPPIQIATDVRYETPAVSFDGEHYLVVWNDTSGVAAVRVGTDGAVVGEPVRLPIQGFPRSVAVAFNGTDHLVAWDDAPASGDVINAARVSRSGELLDPVPVTVGTGGSSVAVASDGHDFLVTWSVFGRVLGGRVAADGTALGPRPIVISDDAFSEASVAWNGRSYLVAWSTIRIGGDIDVLAARVSGAGTVQDPDGILISTFPGQDQNAPRPAVAANGPFLVAWRRADGRQGDVHGAFVAEDGSVRDRPSFPIAASGGDERDIALSPGRGRSFELAYRRFQPEAPIGASRAYVRTVAPK